MSLEFPSNDASSELRSEFVWTNLPTSWGVFVFIAVIAGLVYGIVSLYRREMTVCPLWMKNLLAFLRCCSLLLLAAILVNPALVDVHSRTIEPTIVLCRDASASMGTADNYADPASAIATAMALGKTASELRNQPIERVAVVNSILAKDDAKLITSLAKKGAVELWDFTDQARLVESPVTEVANLPPLTFTAKRTNLAAAIDSGLKSRRPAAIILFTDGQHTSPDDVLQSAQSAKARRVPLLCVGIGDPIRPKVERVASVLVPTQAWQDEPFEIEALVRFQDADMGKRTVELLEMPLHDGNQMPSPKIVGAATVEVPEGGSGQVPVRFSRTSAASGRFVYRARFQSGNSSDLDGDSAMSEVVSVLSRQSIHVLLVAGAPTWDYRLVQTLLSRDKTISLSCWLQSVDGSRKQDGNQPIERLPQTKPELFDYEVILLFDPNPAQLPEDWLPLLRDFVSEHSGGLLYMAGPRYTADLLATPAAEALSSVLPIKVGDLAAFEIESLTAANQQAWPLGISPANADHPLLRFFADRNENIRRWQTLPGIFWSLPIVDAAPAAQILVEHSNPALATGGKARPLMVAGRYGAGNTLYLGFEGTWRWRSAGTHAEFFDKFWVQAVRHLVEGRSLSGRRRGYVHTDQERYEVGQRVTISARLLDAAFQPLNLPAVDARVEPSGGSAETIPLVTVGNGAGRYEAAITAQQTGVTTVRVQIPDATTNQANELTATFVVELPSLEASQTWLNRPLLKQLAAESGGRYFEVDEVDQLPAAVPNRVEKIEERSPPQPVWDTPGMLVVLVGLLSTEWFLRRRFALL